MKNVIAKSLLAAAVVATTATASFAATPVNTFDVNDSQAIDRVLDIDAVNASADGVISVYEFHQGVRGELLGTAPVKSGRVDDLNIKLDPTVYQDVAVVLSVAGQEVYAETIN